MMKVILIVLGLIPSLLLGQVVINSSHMPSSGDTLRYSIAPLDTSVLLNYQLSGANLTWNFDSLISTRQSISEYLNSSNTPYGGSVSNRIGEKLADTLSLGGIELLDVYNFFDNKSSSFSQDYRSASLPTGIVFFPTIPINAQFSDPDEVYQFPLNYLDRDSSTFSFTFNSPPLPGAPVVYYSSIGYRINNVDAWGSITTPFGTFNALKVTTDIISYDSIGFSGTNQGFNSSRREIKWLSPQEKLPILTISGALIAGVFIPATVQYRDSIRNVPSLFAPTALFTANATEYSVNDTVEFNNVSISLFGASYKWSINPNTFNYINNTTSTTDSLFVQFTDTGYYDIKLIARNSDGSDTLDRLQYIKIVSPNGINDLVTNDLKLYPNPVYNHQPIMIELNSNELINRIELFDIKGKKIISKKGLKIRAIQLDIDNLTTGIYFIKVNSVNQFFYKKIIIQ